nr:lipopolysaccharide biosynthesis protein [Myxococcota bacterium]
LQLLAIGFGAFAIFGVLTTVLNSLKRERAGAAVTGLAAALVIALCFARVRGTEFGEALLFRTAMATSTAIAVATAGAALLVYRTAGAVAAPLTLLRVLLAVLAAIAVGRFLPTSGAVATVASAVVVGLAYLVVLIASRELGRADLATLRTVIARRRK